MRVFTRRHKRRQGMSYSTFKVAGVCRRCPQAPLGYMISPIKRCVPDYAREEEDDEDEDEDDSEDDPDDGHP